MLFLICYVSFWLILLFLIEIWFYIEDKKMLKIAIEISKILREMKNDEKHLH